MTFLKSNNNHSLNKYMLYMLCLTKYNILCWPAIRIDNDTYNNCNFRNWLVVCKHKGRMEMKGETFQNNKNLRMRKENGKKQRTNYCVHQDGYRGIFCIRCVGSVIVLETLNTQLYRTVHMDYPKAKGRILHGPQQQISYAHIFVFGSSFLLNKNGSIKFYKKW